MTNPEVFAIFQATGWIEFFERLDGFNREASLQFALHLKDTHSEVWGLRIEFSEAIISEVTAIPRVGKPWFERRVPTMVAREEFMRRGARSIIKERNCTALTATPMGSGCCLPEEIHHLRR